MSALPSGILGIGSDIIEIQRIEDAFLRHGVRFLERLFTEAEQCYCDRYRDPIPHYAGRFAAKEAIVKAFGTGICEAVSWKEMEILNDALGKPEVHLAARLRVLFPRVHLFLSISHCHAYATATAILVG